ncbi:hypothetical protein [Bradyrhizobium ganzhouense]|uniref:hypothetical protein n=1 Tax=Bradyrhizobium ganzhouense TaxID=1179767 RepID=UPI003CF232CF
MSKAKSGGGSNMNKVRSVGVRTGAPTTRIISPGAVSNIGAPKANHATDTGTFRAASQPLVTGNARDVPLGNAVAGNVGRGGPGTGRVVHSTGSQGQHGPAAGSPQPQGRDILGDFGPNRKG